MQNIYLTEERDLPILHFLWKWKMATSATLVQKFFPGAKMKTAYNRLLLLQSHGFIRLRPFDDFNKFVWVLAPRGYKNIQPRLPALQDEGYLSEAIQHDLLVNAVHLGEWLMEKPSTVELFTEQELRRVHPDCHPAWVPHPAAHRSDGYWQIPIRDKRATVSLEVELNLKKDSEYANLGDFYAYHLVVFRVLWVVQGLHQAQKIAANIKSRVRAKPFIHNFVFESEFRISGWNAQIKLGPDKGKSIYEFLWEGPRQESGRVLVPSILCTKKYPKELAAYEILPQDSFLNRVGLSPSSSPNDSLPLNAPNMPLPYTAPTLKQSEEDATE